ncbi:hypothetical protein ACFELC_11745 [Pseudomonas aeruginosa]|uniref:hypothetical protein n=1 Tax=Pseudomonas aeruginosa TaxID=287 RepID=UPI00383B75C7
MKWRSTKSGELFTGGNRWRVELKGDRVTLQVEGEPNVAAHLFQVGSIEVSPGMMWAACHFNFQKGEQQSLRKVDGIPNDRALLMQKVVAHAAADILATFVVTSTPGLEAWLEGGLSQLKPEPGRDSSVQARLSQSG